MDRTIAVNNEIEKFKIACANKGYPLRDTCLKEAYEGDVSTSFILEVVADWIDVMDCSEALDILIDLMWDTMNEETRKKIFSITVFDSKDELHCETDDDDIQKLS